MPYGRFRSVCEYDVSIKVYFHDRMCMFAIGLTPWVFTLAVPPNSFIPVPGLSERMVLQRDAYA